jgi:hypothetical protein
LRKGGCPRKEDRFLTKTDARQLADTKFKKKEMQLLDGRMAMAEYEAARRAANENTARLRALRMARDAAAASAAAAAESAAVAGPKKAVARTKKNAGTEKGKDKKDKKTTPRPAT